MLGFIMTNAVFGDPRLPDRFWEKVAVEFDDRGCWFWTGAKTGSGYGAFRWEMNQYQVHRLVYFTLVKKIEDGFQVDHLCRNRSCCNPAHLEAVSCRENLMRGETSAASNSAKTHCDAGHEFDQYNTYLKKSNGKRACRECSRIAMAFRRGM